jgi:hypothetical protein
MNTKNKRFIQQNSFNSYTYSNPISFLVCPSMNVLVIVVVVVVVVQVELELVPLVQQDFADAV